MIPINDKKGMSIIVKTVTLWMQGAIFAFGIYLLIFGHVAPGGGSAGGIMIGCVFILITLAFGKGLALKKLSKNLALSLSSIGALMFLGLGVAGIFWGNGFMSNFVYEYSPKPLIELLSAGNITLYDLSIGIMISTYLYMVFMVFSVLRVLAVGKEHRMVQEEKENKQ